MRPAPNGDRRSKGEKREVTPDLGQKSSLEHLVLPQSKKRQRLLRSCQKDLKADLKVPLLAKDGTT